MDAFVESMDITAEIKSVFAEGRAQIGKTYAARPVDMARAVSRLGVSEGFRILCVMAIWNGMVKRILLFLLSDSGL
jgi:hypothetical protein